MKSRRPAPARDPDAASQRPLLLALGAAAFVVSLDGRLLAPLLPAVADHFRISIPEASWAVSAYMLPYGLCQLAYGPLAERFGKVRVAGWAMLAFALCELASTAASAFPVLVALRALTGAAAAALIPLTIAYIGDTVPYGQRQAALSMLMATAGAAQAFGVGAGAATAQALSWRSVFPMLGVLAIASWLGVRAHQARELRPPASERPRYREVWAAPGMRRLLVLVGCEGFLYMGGSAFLGALLEARFQLDTREIGLVLALAGASQWLSARAMPRLLQILGERELVLLGGGAMASCFFLAAMADHWAWVALGCVLSGLGFTTCHSTLQTRASEAFPRGRASALSLFAFVLFSGGSLGTSALAYVSAWLGYGTAFGLAALLLVSLTLAAAQPLVAAAPVVARETA